MQRVSTAGWRSRAQGADGLRGPATPVRRRTATLVLLAGLVVAVPVEPATLQASQQVEQQADFQAQLQAVLAAVDQAGAGLFSRIAIKQHLRAELTANHEAYPDQAMPVAELQALIDKLVDLRINPERIGQAVATLDLAAKAGASAEELAELMAQLTSGQDKARIQQTIRAYAEAATALRTQVALRDEDGQPAQQPGGNQGGSQRAKVRLGLQAVGDMVATVGSTTGEAGLEVAADAMATARANGHDVAEVAHELKTVVRSEVDRAARLARLREVVLRLQAEAQGNGEEVARARVESNKGAQAEGKGSAKAHVGAGAQASAGKGQGGQEQGNQSGSSGSGAKAGAGVQVSVGLGAQVGVKLGGGQ